MVVCGGGLLEEDGSSLDERGGGLGGGVVDNSVEAVVVIGGVLHGPDGAVGLEQGVGALHDVAITELLLLLVVAGVPVRYGVRVLVFGVGL